MSPSDGVGGTGPPGSRSRPQEPDPAKAHGVRTALSPEDIAAMIDAAIDCVVAMDHEGRIVEFNPAAERTFGYRRADVIGRLMALTIMPPATRARHEEGLRRYLATGESTVIGQRVEVTAIRADGAEFPAELSLFRLGTGWPPTFAAFLRDLSERRRLERDLSQAQKMEAIGRLAGGIAHEFNNLLAVILGYAEILGTSLDAEDPMRAEVEEIQRAGSRAAHLTRQLLAFSRRQVLAPRVLQLNEVVASMEGLLRRMLGEDVELVAVLDQGLGPVWADPSQMEQVVLSLVVNAREAMPRGGRLTVETANVDLDERAAARHPDMQPGPHVMLAVSDTGGGLEDDAQGQLFEPFVTTTGGGRSGGLSLATVYGVVRQSGGAIEVDSVSGEGTTFTIYLPRTAPDAGASLPHSTAAPSGSETTLIVEDEAGVRRVIRRILRRLGHTVLEADDGPAALRLAEQHAGPIHLLITDVVMPQMSGQEVARRFGQLRPGAPVLFLSGYMDDAIARHGDLPAGADFLRKPFSADTLAQTVRRILDRRT